MSTPEPAAGQFWWPKKGPERIVLRVAPNKAGEVVVSYAEAHGSKGAIPIPAWKAWVQETGAEMELPGIFKAFSKQAGANAPVAQSRTNRKDTGKPKR